MSVTPFSTPRVAWSESVCGGGELRERGERSARRIVVADAERPPQAVRRARELGRLLDRVAERVIDVGGRRPVHTGNLHEPTERDHPDAVLDPVSRVLESGRRKPDVELARLHPECQRGEEVPELVDEDEEAETDDRDEDRHAGTSLR